MKKATLTCLALLYFMIANAQQAYDYVIQVQGSVVTAYPSGSLTKYTGTDAYTVIQAAINALTPAGNLGTGGGSIYISKGAYNLTNELTITGWENKGKAVNAFAQLTIEGEGYSTQIIQSTAAKNALVVKNGASIVLRNLRFYCGVNAKSCLLGDNTGLATEMSFSRSIIDNVKFDAYSSAYPAVYLKNFLTLSWYSGSAENTNYHAMILENNSATTNYGNSHFGFLTTYAGAGSPYAGLLVRNIGNTNFINLLTFGNYECASGYYGIYSEGLKNSTFNLVDIEGVSYPIYFTGTAAAPNHETYQVKVASGYLLPVAAGTAITNTLYTGGNDFNLFIMDNAQTIPISDQSQWRQVNSYNISLYGAGVGNIRITSASTTPLKTSTANGMVTNNHQ